MPSEPTLAEFAEAFEAVRSKHPDAPRLPDGYEFKRPSDPLAFRLVDHEDIFLSWHGSWCEVVPDAAALALCATTAQKVGAWWCKQGGRHGFELVPDTEGEWSAFVTDRLGPITARFKRYTLESACLAALRAIAGADGGEVG